MVTGSFQPHLVVIQCICIVCTPRVEFSMLGYGVQTRFCVDFVFTMTITVSIIRNLSAGYRRGEEGKIPPGEWGWLFRH